MVNWKELGEIPDSEDEVELENEHSDRQINEKSHSIPGEDENGRDIWDFPDSENERNQSPTRLLSVKDSTLKSGSSSPLSSVFSEGDFPSVTEILEDLNDGDTLPARRPNLPVIASPGRTQNAPHVYSAVKPRIQVPLKAAPRDVFAHENPQSERDSSSQALRVAVRTERSLRPRKPIQEHPYLLESAQFSSTWKRHGLKPLKIVTESERLDTNELPRISQDTSFEEDSQESGQQPPSSLPDKDKDSPSTVSDRLGVSYSTPLRQSPPLSRMVKSSPASSQADTEGTSIFDQDLPALIELLTKPPRLSKTNVKKRDAVSPEPSAKKRRRRTIIDSDPVELDSSRVVSTSLAADSPSLNRRPISPSRTNGDTILPGLDERCGASKDEEFLEQLKFRELADEADISSKMALDEDQSELSDSATLSESDDAEAVTAMRSRIRGVLPASWLRLDQQAGREKAETTVRNNHRSVRASMQEARRGVAQLRHTAPRSTAIPDFFEESDDEKSDDESSNMPLATHADHVDNLVESALRSTESHTFPNAPTAPLTIHEDEDSGSSAIEDSHVEFMPASRGSRKRQARLHATTNNKKFNASVKEIHTPTPRPKKPWQTKITGHLVEHGPNDTGSKSPLKRKRTISRVKRGGVSRETKSKKARRRQLQLGILDTIEADAPRILKIAARTAKRRIGQGRSCLQTKTIQLASRQDQIDAMSVMNQWRSGLLKQRNSVTKVAESLRQEKKRRNARRESSGNQGRQLASPLPKITAPRKFVKHVSAGGSVRYSGHSRPGRSPVKQVQPRGALQETTALKALTRPAQLETIEPYRMTKLGFQRRKKILDSLYHHDKSTPTLKELGTGILSDVEDVSPPRPIHSPTDSSRRIKQPTDGRTGPRRRKRTLPRRIDVSAPQYSHANDPVPQRYSTERTPVTNPIAGKLHGLGPYGTQYTHHFEIFPLQPGAFFHESTLIGGGHLQSCATISLPTDWTESRPRKSMTLNTHILRWGSWSAQVSSELGVVLDFVADQLEAQVAESDRPNNCESTPVQAMDFLLSYIKDSLSFGEEGEKLLFVSRTRECLLCLSDRIISATGTASRDDKKTTVVLQVYDRLLLTALIVLKTCRQDQNLVAESFACEELLKKLADALIKTLAGLGAEILQAVYVNLDKQNIRDMGIRDESPAIHSWVMVMRVLDLAQIPRGSFWDLLQQHIAPKQNSSDADAQDHERVWQTMFTLLPLGEFSNSGILVAGRRHEATSDGWGIPHVLMKQVFQLYNANTHQAASFNSYCRALVGRCHFLVQEWGWRKCVSVVGLIFDFFGTHQLAHLRNEEVYKSPSFLENLAGQPSLDIEPEDRCFHVFLKLVALAIRKMREAGSLKDVSNLVARTVPNHNRQHSKDEKVHERDLAALRNHHDLLCTLFWAAPPEHRPSPALIQRLVVPATSHKAACLINLRAWSQLARYVIASGKARTSWTPFGVWRNTFFEQVLHQYHSVASDVALQLAALGKEARHSVSEEMVRRTIDINRTALMEVLYASARASLDVVRQAPDVVSATFAKNTTQLRTIFSHFSTSPPDLKWGILRTSLATLEVMLTKIDEFKAVEESQKSESELPDSALADDALLALDEDLSQSFFRMARCVLSTRCTANLCASARTDDDDCVKHVVIVAARIGMRFVNGGLMRSSDLFNKSKYQMLSALPHRLNLNQRKHFTLFLATLLQYHVDNFDDVGFSLAEVWVCCLVKPRLSLHYELQLGQQLHRLGVRLVPDTISGLCTLPDYNITRDLFEYSVSSMRKSLRDAGPTLHRTLLAEYSSALKVVMEQMKSDLGTTSRMRAGHTGFVVFVQGIISLIKTHASDICAVDKYFYQISQEYSPPAEDPQHQVASIVSYGLKLQDGDARSSLPLFYLLFNNAKFSIFHHTVGEQVVMLVKSMVNGNIKTFILSKMLPAIVNVVFAEPDAFPLLDMYLEALRRCYAAKAVSQELTHQDTTAICTLWRAMWNGVKSVGTRRENLTPRHLHVVRQVVALQNLFWPSLYVLSMSNPTSECWKSLWEMLASLWGVFRRAEGYSEEMRATEWDEEDTAGGSVLVEPESLGRPGDGTDADIGMFTENMMQDVRKCWRVTADSIWIDIQGSNKRGSEGLALAKWEPGELTDDLYDGVREWCWWWRRANGMTGRVEDGVGEVF